MECSVSTSYFVSRIISLPYGYYQKCGRTPLALVSGQTFFFIIKDKTFFEFLLCVVWFLSNLNCLRGKQTQIVLNIHFK